MSSTRAVRRASTFSWRGRELTYLDHPYNSTARNERAWEVPLALAWLEGRPAGGVEVGHVLGHYTDHRHLVVDAHERAPGVVNLDLFELRHEVPWIVAISTLEHVGRDMGERPDPHAALAAVAHLCGLLAPGGSMLATIPRDQHPTLDSAIAHDGLGADRESTWLWTPGGWLEVPGSRHWSATRDVGSWPSAVWVGEWDR